jgi:hypothetical protein
MENDTLRPDMPRLDEMPDVNTELGAVQNLAASRRNGASLRTMFGISTAEAESVNAVSSKENSSAQMPRRILRAPPPRI